MANRVFAFLNTMFRFALNEENNVLEYSPCFGMKKPGGREKKKTRYLKDDEIVKFWNGLNDSLIAPPIINALKLILLTGQRPSEICGIHSDEINNRWWTIPGERTKNGSDHSVYLSDLALETIGPKHHRPQSFQELYPDILNRINPTHHQLSLNIWQDDWQF